MIISIMRRLFLACTPRTGNLWFRKMLATSLDIIETAAHVPAEVEWQSLPPRCIVAMHWERTEEFVALLQREQFESIVTIRHPLDVLVSILHFSQREPATARWLEGKCGNESILQNADPTSAGFLEYALSDRAAALLSVSVQWLPVARSVIRYEDLVADPENVLTRVICALGEFPRSPLAEIVQAHSLAALRPLAEHHFWRGIPGLWRQLIPDGHRRDIYERHRGVFEALGYDCDCAVAVTPEVAQERWRALCQPARRAAAIESLPVPPQETRTPVSTE